MKLRLRERRQERLQLSRRSFLKSTGGAVALPLLGRPGISRAADRPAITHGVQSGDVSDDGAVVWSRSDRPSRMMVEISTGASFRDIQQILYADALPESDFTAKLLLDDLPPGETVFYRVQFADLSFPTISSEAQVGCFRVIGFDVEPWPVDYRTGGTADIWQIETRPSDGLLRTDIMLREWVGLIAYRFQGYTDALFPSPAR